MTPTALLQPGGTVHGSSSPTMLLALNPVRADRADDFEDWLRTVVVPAVHDRRPALAGRWRVLRAQAVEDDVVTFAFLFDGGSAQDWELRPLLDEALGAAGADEALRQMDDMLAGDQVGWSLAPVDLETPSP